MLVPKMVKSALSLMLLSDGKPRSSKEIGGEVGLSRDGVESALKRLWKKSMILRTAKVQISSDSFQGQSWHGFKSAAISFVHDKVLRRKIVQFSRSNVC